MKKIGILTSGGDAPAMNAAIRAAVRTCLNSNVEPYVIYDGYKGLVEGKIMKVDRRFVSEVLNRGGTIIGTARLNEFKDIEFQKKAVENLRNLSIEGLVVIGGDGTFRGANELCELGIKCIGVAGTIDNDINSAGYTIGFDTALNTIVEAVDKIRDTSSSHNRCSIVEVMGRHCGDLALYSSIACGADILIDPNTTFNEEEMYKDIIRMKEEGRRHVLIIVSENLLNCQELANKIQENTGFETRANILGHFQRGGNPTAMDRFRASVLGSEAVKYLLNGESDKMIYLSNKEVKSLPFDDAIKQKVIDYTYLYDVNKMIG
jgi:6-phosphofructokinase 1